MEGNKRNMKPRALLVFGAPCSGKTTFGENFAKKFKLAFFDLDEIRGKYRLSHKLVMMLVEQLAKTRQDLVIEGELKTEKERSEMRRVLLLAGYNPTLVWVQTDVSTLRTRLKSRFKTVAEAKSTYEKAIECLEAPAEYEHPVVISGKHTFETQAKHVLLGLK